MSGDARDFNNIETQAVIKFSFSCKARRPKEIDAILTETLACIPYGYLSPGLKLRELL